MSGDEDLYKLTNFPGIKTTKWRIADRGKVFLLGMSVKEIYTRLAALGTGFLKRDAFRYTKTKQHFHGIVKKFPGCSIIKIQNGPSARPDP